ncbi:unnamed protein product [Nesidiocoris tenuis]|uniref:Reverse transcriptase domain-containing protein n=1 Tax=Nesidiocoris tenuis TaxID=355587 RepID=A0A6H5GRP9_9HEMI|nr:unnamed protein product [Nesidiocoris tenuis]
MAAFLPPGLRKYFFESSRQGIEPQTIKRILAMLASGNISSELGGSSIAVVANRGCRPQGGVLSPLLWLLGLLTGECYEVVGYADDLAIIIRGKFDSTLSDRLQGALDITHQWCEQEGLHLNPNKTVIVPFTNRRRLNIVAPTLAGSPLTLSDQVRYLGVILDRKLTWKLHVKHVVNKASGAMWNCRRMLGKT